MQYHLLILRFYLTALPFLCYIDSMKCDLHIHTNCSDGIYSPQQIITMASERGLHCVAITDHDTVAGVEVAKQTAKQLGIHCITGVELSCVDGCEVHVLGYNLDTTLPGFEQDIQQISNMRHYRNQLIVQKLAEHGFPIDLDELCKKGSVGRGVLAREMVRLGYCQSVPEVFEKYLGVDKCCYVQAKRLTPTEGIQFILKHGGIPVLAHPKQLHMDITQLEEFIKPLVAIGLAGMEALYFAHNSNERKIYSKLAKKYNLIETGGSDFHDYTHGIELGTQSFSPNGYTKKILGI